MTVDIEKKKEALIKRIKSVEQEEDIVRLEVLLSQITTKTKSEKEIFKPMRNTITVEELRREQNYNGIDRNEFDELIKQLDIEEPVEELIEMI